MSHVTINKQHSHDNKGCFVYISHHCAQNFTTNLPNLQHKKPKHNYSLNHEAISTQYLAKIPGNNLGKALVSTDKLR